ncbi:MAG: YceI family protein [Flavobacteriaceae bacterium]
MIKALLSSLFLLKVFSFSPIDPPIIFQSEKSNIEITGTTNISKWKSKVEDFQIKAISQSSGQIEKIELILYTNSIKSGHRPMDKMTQKSLKVENFPEITIIFDQINYSENEVLMSGLINLAGISKEIQVKTQTTYIDNNLILSGQAPINLNEFNICPPEALFGSIRCNENIIVDFSLRAKNS